MQDASLPLKSSQGLRGQLGFSVFFAFGFPRLANFFEVRAEERRSRRKEEGDTAGIGGREKDGEGARFVEVRRQ